MSSVDPRTYCPQDRILYFLLILWLGVWSIDLVAYPFENPSMLLKLPGGLAGAIILIQVLIPRLRFSGLANMVAFATLLATTGFGFIARAV